ncbi:MAG: hypothetical protein KKA79_08825, partial [Nanoarchaeota archaeon]|nr:hypothetical protein [Nanoarchaeota archaeon]
KEYFLNISDQIIQLLPIRANVFQNKGEYGAGRPEKIEENATNVKRRRTISKDANKTIRRII